MKRVGPIYGIRIRNGAIPVKNMCIHHGIVNPLDKKPLIPVGAGGAGGVGIEPGKLVGKPGIFEAIPASASIAIDT